MIAVGRHLLPLKIALRNMLPSRLQVPVKYWLSVFRRRTEAEMPILRHLLTSSGRFVDVGANRGVYAYHAWRLGFPVEAFEPNPTCATILTVWAQGKSNVRVHPVALSNRTGLATLHIPVDDAGVEHDASASIANEPSGVMHEVTVPIETLDSYALADVQLIKIDVEGHESQVIEGSLSTISSARPALIIEIEQRHSASPIEGVFEKITRLGYNGYFLENARLSPLSSFNLGAHQARSAFGRKNRVYVNNFIFLCKSRCGRGEYKSLLSSVK